MFLQELLAPGPLAFQAVRREATQAGITDITLRRAKVLLQVESGRRSTGSGGDGDWVWTRAQPPCGSQTVAPQGDEEWGIPAARPLFPERGVILQINITNDDERSYSYICKMLTG